MIKRDFHDWLLADAEREIEIIISEVRMKGTTEPAEFITGRGKIRESIQDLIRSYGLNAELQWGNDGVVIAMIE